MKLYDGGRAPNPRRVRIFLAEKAIALPLEPVDLGSLQHKSSAYAAVNPLQRVPALELDDGTVLTESDRDLPLFRGIAARAAAVRARRPGKGAGRDVEQADGVASASRRCRMSFATPIRR